MTQRIRELWLRRGMGVRFQMAFTSCVRIAGLLALLVATPVAAQNDPGYQLGTGDELRITVFGHPDLSGKFHVGSNGAIAMPLVGELRVEKMTLQQAERAIIDKLKPDYLRDPQVSVDVLNYRPFYIVGEVRNPGSYPYVGGMTIVNAVAMAGGFTYRARESRIRIKRAGGDGTAEPASQNTLVRPGDVIEVPERYF